MNDINEKYNITIDNNSQTFILQIQQGNTFIINTTTKDTSADKFITELKKLIENYGK